MLYCLKSKKKKNEFGIMLTRARPVSWNRFCVVINHVNIIYTKLGVSPIRSFSEAVLYRVTDTEIYSYKILVTRKLEDHWSCVAHLSSEDTYMLKSAVIEKKKFKNIGSE